jgi:uncharacterized membrane protein (UPF0127 family)
MSLRNQRSGLLVAAVLEPAFDSASRKRGLLGRDGLPSSYALVIAPCNMVHTFFMRFAIDVLIVSRRGLVVKAAAAVPARRLVGAFRGFAVIEMAAGQLALSDTRAGDVVILAPGTATGENMKVPS